MVKNNIISAMKANRLYWLGRYEERVYMTLHILRKCYDKMIDGEPADYETFWQKLDVYNSYSTTEGFLWGMMFDETTPTSVLSAQIRAQDNAMLLREDIMSETLSYIEMSVALMRRIKEEGTQNITNLQSVTDWALAFWGSAQQRVLNMKALALLLIGRCIEDIDMMVRFGYPYYRIEKYYQIVTQYLNDNPDFFDEHIKRNLDAMLTEKQYDPEDAVYKDTLLKYINQLIFV